MFDLGFSELFLIGVISLLVLGPERLPKAARTVGALLRRARSSYMSLKSDIERELAADELKRSIKSVTEPAESIRETVREMSSASRDFEAELRQVDRAHAEAEIDSALGPGAQHGAHQDSPAPKADVERASDPVASADSAIAEPSTDQPATAETQVAATEPPDSGRTGP